jgi:hypothetical protein
MEAFEKTAEQKQLAGSRRQDPFDGKSVYLGWNLSPNELRDAIQNGLFEDVYNLSQRNSGHLLRMPSAL